MRCVLDVHAGLAINDPKESMNGSVLTFDTSAKNCATNTIGSAGVAAELKRLRWTEEILKRRQKSDEKKVRIARCVAGGDDLKWIAGLQMGTWTLVSNFLSRQRRKPK